MRVGGQQAQHVVLRWGRALALGTTGEAAEDGQSRQCGPEAVPKNLHKTNHE